MDDTRPVLPVPVDFDTDPDRWRRGSASEDVHEPVADRLATEGAGPVLDVGCGRGRLEGALAGRLPWSGVDMSPTQLQNAPRPVVRGMATELPFPDASVGSVTALWMLYHLPDPQPAIAEARRVLRSGGLFVACSERRDDAPELLPRRPPTPFDAEDAPAIVAEIFGDVEVERWDDYVRELPDRDAVCDFLISHFADARLADAVETPLRVTKRGVLVWARKR